MTYKLYNDDNRNCPMENYDLVYADMIYENELLDWAYGFWHWLKPGGIYIVQTDFHTNYIVRSFFEDLHDSVFVNHLVWKNEWGNHPKNKFHQCYDDIIIFAKKGRDYKFYPDRIQVDKATKNKGLNPSGRQTKQATAWIDDICLTTTSKERIKKSDGHLVKWQKPYKLMDRILSPFTDEGDLIVEPFGGTFSACRWAIQNNRNCIGIEYDKEIFDMGKMEVERAIYKREQTA